jgi:hypothetical protein
MSPPRSRLPLRLYLHTVRCWIAVRFLLRQHPVRCLGQMPPNSSDRLRMPSSAFHPLVQTTDMAPRVSPSMDHHCVGCLSIRPLQIMIDVRACASVSNVSSTGMHSWSLSGIRSQMACTRESLDITNLGEDDHPERNPRGQILILRVLPMQRSLTLRARPTGSSRTLTAPLTSVRFSVR